MTNRLIKRPGEDLVLYSTRKALGKLICVSILILLGGMFALYLSVFDNSETSMNRLKGWVGGGGGIALGLMGLYVSVLGLKKPPFPVLTLRDESIQVGQFTLNRDEIESFFLWTCNGTKTIGIELSNPKQTCQRLSPAGQKLYNVNQAIGAPGMTIHVSNTRYKTTDVLEMLIAWLDNRPY